MPANEESVRVESSFASWRAFEGDGEPTRNQFGMATCDRDEAIGRHAPCDGCEVGAGAGLRRPPFAPRRQRIDLVGREKIVEANRAVGHIASRSRKHA